MKELSSAQVKHFHRDFPFVAREVIRGWTNSPLFARLFGMNSLDDGTYDAMVVNASEDANGVMHLELALSSGAHRGEVVSLTATNMHKSWIDVLGAPATLIITDGAPRVTFE